MLLNLVLARKRGLDGQERLSRTVFPETGTKRRDDESAMAAPDKERQKQSLLAGFEEMLAAYASLVMRDLRD